MKDRKEIINHHYMNYDEDSRLIKDNTHRIEFIVSKTYIDKYLKENDKILEIGAGTGRYSLHYAEKGYEVTAIEYVNHNLEILKSKTKDYMNIRAEQGDAIDLSRFEDNTFDVTLVLGPLYHLYSDSDIEKAISEAIRVTKENGVIAIAYITNEGVFSECTIDHLVEGYQNEFDESFKLLRQEKSIFATFYVNEFKDIMNNYNVTLLNNVATDGIANIISDKINAFSKEEFELWVKYQLSICEREDLQGYSCHMLYICRKNESRKEMD